MNTGNDYKRKPDSVGPPVPVCDVAVIPEGYEGSSPDERIPSGPDVIGELWIKGPNVVRGYWNKPEETAVTFTDGWLHSGDVARIDEEGFVYIVDRAKDMVIRGGENVYSVEVEATLFEHPAVADVAVIGVPHPMLGEEVGAAVVLRPGKSVSADELVTLRARTYGGVQRAHPHLVPIGAPASESAGQGTETRVARRARGRCAPQELDELSQKVRSQIDPGKDLMAVCPRCNANVPDGTERCLVCGYGLPGTSAEREDPKDTPPAKGDSGHTDRRTELVEKGTVADEGGSGSGVPPRDPDETSLFTATERQAITDGGSTGEPASDRGSAAGDMDRTSVMETAVTGGPSGPVEPPEPPGSEGPRRRFPFNTVLVVAVAVIAIGVLVFALTSSSGSSKPPNSSTTSTTKSHVVVTTSSSTTTSTTAPPSTTTSSTSTTTTTIPASTTTTEPSTTTTTPSTTTTTEPSTTSSSATTSTTK